MSTLSTSLESGFNSAVTHHWADYGGPQQPLQCSIRYPTLSVRSSLFFAAGLLLVLEVADIAICAFSPCYFFSVGSKEALLAGECVEEYELILTIKLVGYLVCFILAAVHVCGRAALAVRMSGTFMGRWKLPSSEGIRASHAAWVCVASPDLYAELVASLRASNILIGLTSIPVTAVLMGVHVSESIARLNGSESEEITEVCGPNELCRLGKIFNIMFEAFVLQVWAAVTVQFVTMPPTLWGPTTSRAFCIAGDETRRRRLARAPYLAVFSLAAITYMNVHLYVTELSDDAAYEPVQATQRGVLFLTSLLCVVAHLSIAWNTMLVQDTFLFVLEGAGQLWVALSRVQPTPSDDIRRAPDALRNLKEASCGHKRDQALMLFIVVLGYRVVSAVPIASAVVIYAARVVLALLIICLHDAEADFHDLVHDRSPGFGLVVQAAALRRALAASLEKGAADEGTADLETAWGYRRWWQCRLAPRGATLPRYKATLQRMQETLAVSYRWQGDRVPLCAGMHLNMSAFQRKTLSEAIQTVRPVYVWLDQLSVSQDGGPLMLTLLARMMAVYAAASATLAILSAETPGNRYHQRVWTCQEYCTARRLRVRTERGRLRDSVVAVLGDEHQEFEDLRMQFRDAGDEVVPLWLRRDSISAERARSALCTYRSLSGRLFCEVPTDKIHALIPLMARTPVCNHEELQRLVHELGEAAGEDVTGWMGALEEQANVSMRTVAWGLGSEDCSRGSLRLLPDWLILSVRKHPVTHDAEAGRCFPQVHPSRAVRCEECPVGIGGRRTYSGTSGPSMWGGSAPLRDVIGSWSGETTWLTQELVEDQDSHEMAIHSPGTPIQPDVSLSVGQDERRPHDHSSSNHNTYLLSQTK